MSRYPGWRTMTASQRYNARKDWIFDEARRLEADQKTVAERKWSAPSKAPKPQQPCDIGLFSDEMDQVEMFMDPAND